MKPIEYCWRYKSLLTSLGKLIKSNWQKCILLFWLTQRITKYISTVKVKRRYKSKPKISLKAYDFYWWELWKGTTLNLNVSRYIDPIKAKIRFNEEVTLKILFFTYSRFNYYLFIPIHDILSWLIHVPGVFKNFTESIIFV